MPLIIPTLIASWLTIRWLYPPETAPQPPDHASWHAMVHELGPWSRDERKVLGWLLCAILLWATDFWHHISPAAIGLTIGLILTLPGLGVLDIKAVKALNFVLIVFVGGVISMANVLTATHALATLEALLSTWHDALLSNAWRATLTLYWGSFLYRFLVGSEYTVVSTLLPVLLQVATTHGYNLAAMGMLMVFAGGGKLFVYQSAALMLVHSYGFLQAKELLKVGAVLTVVEGVFILLLVPLYWPLIGLPWRPQAAPPAATWAQVEEQPGQFDWRSLEPHPLFVDAVCPDKQVGLQVQRQSTPAKPAPPAWVHAPQIEVATEPGKTWTWPAVWSPGFHDGLTSVRQGPDATLRLLRHLSMGEL